MSKIRKREGRKNGNEERTRKSIFYPTLPYYINTNINLHRRKKKKEKKKRKKERERIRRMNPDAEFDT